MVTYNRAVESEFRKGPFAGKKIKDIGETLRGLLYLDRMRDVFQPGTYGGDCLTAFFADGDTEKELTEILATNRHPGDWRS